MLGLRSRRAALQTIESILAGETIETSLEWDTTDVEPGEYPLKIVASAPDHNGDSNDAALLTVALPGADDGRGTHSGDYQSQTWQPSVKRWKWLQRSPTMGRHQSRYQSDYTWLGSYNRPQRRQRETSSLIAPGSSSEVVLQWDSTGESVGTHTLKVAAELPEDTTADDNEDLLEIELFRSRIRRH